MGGRDRLQSGHTRPDDEHPRRLDRAGGRHHHREHLGQDLGRLEHGLVARDRRHRAEHVHALRAGDPRDQFHREQDDAPFGQRLDRFAGGQRLGTADDDLSGTMTLDVGPTLIGVGAERSDL
jgi:hypothetical protein